MRAAIRAEMLAPAGGWEPLARMASAREGVMPLGFERPENRQYVGKRLDEIADMRGQHWIDAVMDLLIAEEQRIGTVYFLMTRRMSRSAAPAVD